MTSSMSWLLTGNSGTKPSTTFVGTSDDQALVVGTNGTPRALIDTSGNIQLAGRFGVGTSSPRSIVEATANAAGALGPIITLTNTGGEPERRGCH